MRDQLDHPALRHLFGAYLNRDWPETYGSVAAAVDAYRGETSAERRLRAVDELDELTTRDAYLGDRLVALGLEYVFDAAHDPHAFAAELRRQLAR